MSDMSMLINGLKVTAERGATFERRNPLDGSVASRAPAASPQDAVMAVDAAAEAFKTWSQTGPSERRALLLKAADALEAKTPQFIEAVSAETGATGMWGGFNVMLAAGMIREAAALTTQISGEVIHLTCRVRWLWGCANLQAWCWALHPGTRPSFWVCAPFVCRWPVAIR